MAWKSINPVAWVFEKEKDYVEGTYLYEEKQDEYSKQYYLDTNEGLFFVWGSIVLDRRMKHITPGSRIKVIYLGLKTSDKSRKYHDFDVQVYVPDTKEVVKEQ